MQIKAEEIASVLEKEILDFKKEMDVSEVGEVIQVGDGGGYTRADARVNGVSDPLHGAPERMGSSKVVVGLGGGAVYRDLHKGAAGFLQVGCHRFGE